MKDWHQIRQVLVKRLLGAVLLFRGTESRSRKEVETEMVVWGGGQGERIRPLQRRKELALGAMLALGVVVALAVATGSEPRGGPRAMRQVAFDVDHFGVDNSSPWALGPAFPAMPRDVGIDLSLTPVAQPLQPVDPRTQVAEPPTLSGTTATLPEGLGMDGPGEVRPIEAEATAPAGPDVGGTIKMLPFQEAHWQGIELIPLTPTLGKTLGIPEGASGVIADDVTMPADIEGFQAGDLIVSVGQRVTPNLHKFVDATKLVRERRRVEIGILRKGERKTLVLTALQGRLGVANGETAPMIRPGSQPPHRYLGRCTNCHRIGNNGQLPVDQGDLLTKTAPTIHRGQTPPHRDRGACGDCHQIVP